jgi:hypothetical protein
MTVDIKLLHCCIKFFCPSLVDLIYPPLHRGGLCSSLYPHTTPCQYGCETLLALAPPDLWYCLLVLLPLLLHAGMLAPRMPTPLVHDEMLAPCLPTYLPDL